MEWLLSHRADPPAVRLADRHYSRGTPGTAQFMRPCRDVVLVSRDRLSVWATAWQKYIDHPWRDAWECVIFRREGGTVVASELIRQALAVTRWKWPDPPRNGMVTMVDSGKTRHKRDPGRCFIRAGFVPIYCCLPRGSKVVLQASREFLLTIEPEAPRETTMDLIVYDNVTRTLSLEGPQDNGEVKRG